MDRRSSAYIFDNGFCGENFLCEYVKISLQKIARNAKTHFNRVKMTHSIKICRVLVYEQVMGCTPISVSPIAMIILGKLEPKIRKARKLVNECGVTKKIW
jgi:hypothetical protein